MPRQVPSEKALGELLGKLYDELHPDRRRAGLLHNVEPTAKEAIQQLRDRVVRWIGSTVSHGTATGCEMGDDGDVLSGASVSLVSRRAIDDVHRTTTDAHGVWIIDGVVAGPADITVRAVGAAPYTRVVTVVPDRAPVELPLAEIYEALGLIEIVSRHLAEPTGPRADLLAAEREKFREQNHGRVLAEVESVAFTGGINGLGEAQRDALKRLVSWDLRYLHVSGAARVLRDAQVADDKVVLHLVGDAFSKNIRYRIRAGDRGQRRLNRTLLALTYGGRRSFNDDTYAREVFERLTTCYRDADVPRADPAWKALDDKPYFMKVLRRLGLRTEKRPKRSVRDAAS